MISSSELGKFKLEYMLDEAFFLAPKTYSIYKEGEDKPIIRAKGPAHDHMDHAWFKETYANPEKVKSVLVSYDFRISWDSLLIGKKPGNIRIGNLQLNTKRIPIFGENQLWVNTIPKDIYDIGGYVQDIIYIQYKKVKTQFEMDYKQLLLEKDKESTEAMKAALEAKNKAIADRKAALVEAERALAALDAEIELLGRELAKLESPEAETERDLSEDGSSCSGSSSPGSRSGGTVGGKSLRSQKPP